MPFIKGRFHINPIAGQALEAAREAEAALLALEHAAQQERQRQGIADGGGNGGDGAPNDNAGGTWNDHANSANAPTDGPIHRVEIEASEMVPSHQGRAVRGYVARVHRMPVATGQRGSSARDYDDAAADSPQSGTAVGSRQSYGAARGTSRGASAQQQMPSRYGSNAALRGPAIGAQGGGSSSASPETHVFADHRDLVSFLRDELAKDCK